MDKIYVKSNAALVEFQQGNRSLSLRHRQLLIMVDGKRTDSEIAKIFNSNQAIAMLVDLEKLGFINSGKVSNQSVFNVHQAVPDSTPLSQEHIIYIKTFLSEEAQLQLGLMSRDIEQRIALVNNAENLKSCVARWHMAIRESRNGRTVADKLMERLAHLMANPPQVKASENAS